MTLLRDPHPLLLLLLALALLLASCTAPPDKERETTEARLVLETHLRAIASKDLTTLKNTLSPSGEMELILPGQEISGDVDSFVEMHEAWFKEAGWSFDWQILKLEVGQELALATTEILYREPERNGKPYFNRMSVSYVLRKENGTWYVIKDHASSAEKSEELK